MKNIYFTVGPTQLYPTIGKHLQTAIKNVVGSQNHRGPWFHDLFAETTQKLKTLLSIPKTYQIFFCSSGTESMERSIQNLTEKKSFHVITGAFGKRWASIAKEMGKEPELYRHPKLDSGSSLDFGSESGMTVPTDSEMICFTQNDTSTGMWIDPNLITKTKKQFPKKLIAVDVVSSIPYVDLDYKSIDTVFFSVQKGFGLPAGLGIIIVSPAAIEKADYLLKKGISIGSYHNFPTLLKYAQKSETPETPTVLHLWLLSKVLEDMLKIGIDTIRYETREKSALLYDFFKTHSKWQPFVTEQTFQSPTTLAIDFSNQTEDIKQHLQKKGIIVGSGYGEYKSKHLRIANFPAHKKEDIQNLINELSTY